MTGRPVTDADRAEIRDLKTAGYTIREIASKVGRSRSTVWLVLDPEADERKREKDRQRIRAPRGKPRLSSTEMVDRKPVPHASLTAALMGDPTPGRSALDRTD